MIHDIIYDTFCYICHWCELADKIPEQNPRTGSHSRLDKFPPYNNSMQTFQVIYLDTKCHI